MSAPLNILHLEDDLNDARLIHNVLAAAGLGCVITRVDTRAAFVAVLEQGGVELVLSNYALPDFDGLAALRLVRERWPLLPFVMISGSLGEEVAVECLQNGAADYVLKDRLSRLVPTVNRALADRRRQVERQMAERELRWRSALLEAQMNASIDGLLVVDEQGQIILRNERLLELWHLEGEMARNADDARQLAFVVAQVRQPDVFMDKIRDLYANPQATSRDEIERVDGTVLDRYTAPVRDKTGAYYGRIWVFRDITEQKQLEAQLGQAQKMEAVGRLAAGVAHDFNNLLTVILGYSDWLLGESGLAERPRDSLQEVKNAALRAAELTRKLLAFSRQQVLQPKEVDLSEVVANCVRLLERVVGEDIHLEVRLNPGQQLVRVDPGQLEQALINLVVNARDAIARFGKISIETSLIVLDEAHCRTHPPARPGLHAVLTVTDTGCGMDAATLGRIFEPFFTTKEPGKGTGLGLAMVFGFIQQSYGHIVVTSAPGQGTGFTIYLPLLAAPAGEKSPVPAEPGMPGGAETILLVEDESSVRNLTRQVLEERGYRVLEAGDGAEALRVAADHAGRLALLISDVVMPGMGGGELAAAMQAAQPGLKVLLVSGYSGDALHRHGGVHAGLHLLTKPFTLSALVMKVREVLDR